MLLDRLLGNLKMTVEPFATCQIADGCELRLEEADWVTAHFILDGTGSITVGRRAPKPLTRLSLALVPPGRIHTIFSDDQPSPPLSGPYDVDGLRLLQAGPPGAPSMVVACGRIQATYGAGLGLFDRLTDSVVLDFGDESGIARTLRTMLDESRDPRPGANVILAAAMNQCLVAVFRRLSDSDDSDLLWLTALEDPHLAPAIDAVLASPGDRHSVESMASHASMSRSAFSQNFSIQLGRTPMAWVRDVRLRLAAELLTSTSLSVGVITRRVGFSSRSHFSHAFTDYFGHSPTHFRSTNS